MLDYCIFKRYVLFWNWPDIPAFFFGGGDPAIPTTKD